MSIRNKLIIYTFVSIFITLVIAGIAIDRIFTNLYDNNAIEELKDSYSNFLHELETIEHDILNQTLLIASDTSVIAVSNMVNRYENKKNYQPLIFNNDKKKIAVYLLKQIILTKAEQAILYNKNGELIAYAIHNKKINEAGFSSYKKEKPITIKLTSPDNKWLEAELPESIAYKIKPLNNEVSFLSYSGKVKYLSRKDSFIVENNRIIYRKLSDGKNSLLGIIKVNKSLDDVFFKTISSNGHSKISLLLQSGHLLNHQENLLPIANIDLHSKLHGSVSSTGKVLTNENYYIQSYIWPTNTGKNYLLTTNSRTELISALNKTRRILMLSFTLTAILAIVFGIYWLNKLISKPLHALTEKAIITNIKKLPQFPISKGNDEISLLGKVLNDMVAAIKNRENQLIENEAQLGHTQKLAKIGGWKIDHENNIVNFTDEIFNILEIDKALNTASTELIHNIIHPDDVNMVQETYDECMSQHTPYDVTHRLCLKDGTIKTVHVYSETLFDSKGIPLTTKGTIQDITEQTSKDEQLRRSQKLDAIGKLTGGIAHDFNNMLGVILGFTELLLDNPELSTKEKKYLNQIGNAGERASKLTSKLLAFSRKDNATATCIDLNKVLLDEQIMLEKTLTVRINLKFELFDDLWSIWLDKDELEDAIVNMSINAMHAMPSGGELTLATQNRKLSDIDVANMNIPAGNYILLSITDNGTGMSQETLTNIFVPFFTTKDEMGTGLGMSQVYGFVKRSHGAITINSELGHGTRLTLYFPRHLKNESTSELLQEVNPNIDLTGNATILIVDDELALRNLAKEILSSKGYNILTAESGAQALKILKTETVDLVLSDVIMPDMDGYQLAYEINKHYPDIKIQMASGFSDVKDPNILESSLHMNRLQKPYNSEILLKKIKEML